jgi:pectate lyase
MLKVENPFLSIYGQTAPAPGVIIRGAVLWIDTHDILVQHIKVRVGDDNGAIEPNSRDCLIINSGYNIIIDHCSFSWSIDELASVDESAHDVTFSNCIFGEALDKSLHWDVSNGIRLPERHSYGILANGENLTFLKNFFAFTYGRNPLIRKGKQAIINNLIYATGWAGPMIQFIDDPVYGSIVGNVVLPMLEHELFWGVTKHAAYAVNVHPSPSELFLKDNKCYLENEDPKITEWEKLFNNDAIAQASSSPIDLGNYSISQSSKVKDNVLQNAGAFYWNRDYVDSRIVNSAMTRTDSALVHSPFPLPARAYHWDFENKTEGNVKNGHDWSEGKEKIIINGNTLTLQENCDSPDEVVSYLNSLLPDSIIAYRLNKVKKLDFVGFKTKAAGPEAKLDLSGNGLATFGIEPGAYWGSDGKGYDFNSDYRQLKLPPEPHNDTDNNGFTNLEEWVHDLTTSIKKNAKNTKTFVLHQNYPNPFNPSTTIEFEISRTFSTEVSKHGAVRVQLTIYNILGKKIKTLVDKKKLAGKYEVRFDGSGLASGIYYYKLTAGKHSAVRKMLLLK